MWFVFEHGDEIHRWELFGEFVERFGARVQVIQHQSPWIRLKQANRIHGGDIHTTMYVRDQP